MEQVALHFKGTSPLLMHNNVTVNPLDAQTKAIKQLTGKRKKTEEDTRQIMRLEWEAGLYFDPAIGPYIPGANIETCLRDAGKLSKQGASVTRAVVVADAKLPLLYKGPRGTGNAGPQELYEQNYFDYRVVGNQANSVMRCRPSFPQWELDIPILLESNILDPDDLTAIAGRAGLMIGLGDYRPRFGRFESTRVV